MQEPPSPRVGASTPPRRADSRVGHARS
jgi:hypothetical protein